MSIHDPHKIEVDTAGNWNETHYSKVKTGDKFRMFHQDGKPFYYDHDDEVEYFATSEPYFDEELEVWFINIK